MSVTVTVNRVGMAQGRAAGGVHAEAGAFGARAAQALGNLGQGAQRETERLYQIYERHRREMEEAQDLTWAQEFGDRLQKEDAAWRGARQGEEALNAQAEYEARAREILDEFRGRFPEAKRFERWKREKAQGIQRAYVGSGIGYGIQQANVFKASTVNAERERALRAMENPGLTEEERTGLWNSYRAEQLKIQPGRLPDELEQDEALRRKASWQAYERGGFDLAAQGRLLEAAAYAPEPEQGQWGGHGNIPVWAQEAGDTEQYRRFRDRLQQALTLKAERAEQARLDGIYTQWREEARKMELSLEETQSFMTGRISDRLQDPRERKYVMGLNMDDLRVETLRQDAGDMTGIMEAEKATRDLLPSQKITWLEENWQGSRAGYEKAVHELTRPPKLETPENMERLGALRVKVDLGQITSPEEAKATAYANGLTMKQTEELLKYQAAGGQAGLVRDIDVQRIWGILNKRPNGKAPPMPLDLPDLVRRELQSEDPGRAVTGDLLNKTIARLAIMGESRAQDEIFIGFGKDESRAEALRNNRASTWLPDALVPEYNKLQKTGLDVQIRELLAQNNITPTAEKIVLFSQDEGAMEKYGLTHK